MLSKLLAASLPSVIDYYWLNRPRARSNLLNDRYKWRHMRRIRGRSREGQRPRRSVRQMYARRRYKQSCFSRSRRKVSRRKFIPGILGISLYRVGDEIKRDMIKEDGKDERGRGIRGWWMTIKGRRCSKQFRNGEKWKFIRAREMVSI